MVHDLEQNVENVWMRLLDLIEQQHRMRFLGHRLGQQSTLVKSDIARRSSDQAGNRMPFHVLRHVKANQFYAQDERELLRDLGFANSGRAREQERANWLLRFPETRPGHFDRGCERFDRLILTKDDVP